MSSEPALVYLCDLTYTQQTISSDVMPAAIGCIATYAERDLEGRARIEIFKFPEKLIGALEAGAVPRAIGFSNYAWNEDLSAQVARVIKAKLPGVVTIFGGPNYPNNSVDQERFLRQSPHIDFYVLKEGEISFTMLMRALLDADFSAAAVPETIPSVHRITPDGRFVAASTIARVTDMSEIPSPYLAGKMEPFFDGVMLPIIQTSRGCPFQCTFCVEGSEYFNKVAKTKTAEKVDAELEYIAARMAKVRDEKGGRSDLHIADSNFGMYKEDMQTAQFIADKQRRYAYPEYIMVATGKNHKERVIEAASVLNGALQLSGSVQSLDADVLKNIKRSNINAEQIMDLALSGSKIGANSYSEVILGLPGDTVEAHLKTIQIIVGADFNLVCLYQLMLLPGTDLATPESVEKWRMTTRYRAIPRCYGYYDLFGEEINACEIERICVSNASLSFDDYLQCRKMHLVINLFYNDGVLKEVLRFIRSLGLSVYEWLELIYRDTENTRLQNLVADFLKDTQSELWLERQELRAFTRKRENIRRFISGEFGANLIFKYRSRALLDCADDIADVARRSLRALLVRNGVDDGACRLGDELVTYGHARFLGLFDHSGPSPEHTFQFDVLRFAADAFPGRPDLFRLEEPATYRFVHTAEQTETVANYISIYGNSLGGLGRILSKIYVRRLFRQPVSIDKAAKAHVNQRELRAGQASLTGLNEFG